MGLLDGLTLVMKQILSIIIIIVLLIIGWKIFKKVVGIIILAAIALAILYYIGWLF